MNELVYMISDKKNPAGDYLKEAGFNVVIKALPIDEELLSQAYALVPGFININEEILQKAKNLKIISKFGVGMDRIDIPACTRHHVAACNTPLSNYISVAEHTLALILGAAKKLYPISINLHKTDPDWAKSRYSAIELYGKTISIIGFGNIGKRVARLLSGFDMNIIAYDPYGDENNVPEYVEFTRDLDYALKQADFVTIHASGDSAHHLIGEKQLSLMKQEAILINTTRGHVIDEEALIKALKEKRIAGAAFDVFAKEPIDAGNELLEMENVLVTPHNAAHTPEASMRSQYEVAQNIIDFRDSGTIPKTALNRKELLQADN